MRIFASLTLVLLSACTASRRETSYPVEPLPALPVSTTSMEEDEISARIPEELPRLRVRIWKDEVLLEANLLQTLQMHKTTRTKLIGLDQRLRFLPGWRGDPDPDLRAKLLSDRAVEGTKLWLIERHLPSAPMPLHEEEELSVWKKSILDHADDLTVSKLRLASAERIGFLEGKLTELGSHPVDVVWDDYLHYSLLMRFELRRIDLIDLHPDSRG